MEDRTTIEWDKDDIEALRILKVDVLGLGMLTCIRRGFDLIAQHHGRRIALEDLPPDDPRDLCHAARARMPGRLPGGKPRADEHAAAPAAQGILRPGGRRSRSCARARSRATWCIPICAGDRARSRSTCRPVRARPAGRAEQVLGKTSACRCSRNRRCSIAIVGGGVHARPGGRVAPRHGDLPLSGQGLAVPREVRRAAWRAAATTQDFAERCFRQIEGFGTYGFPESHAMSFALLVYVSRLGEVPPPRGLRGRAAEQPAHGLLRAGADRARCEGASASRCGRST